MFRKILVPIDGSDSAARACELSAALAVTLPEAHVTLVVAVAPFTPEDSDLDEGIIAQQNAMMRRMAQQALDRGASVLADYRIDHTTRVIEGNPVSQAIADEARTGGYDLIVLASRGMGMDRHDHDYVGSVADHIIRRVSVPVLVLPIHKD